MTTTIPYISAHPRSCAPAGGGSFRQFETDSGSRVVAEHTHGPAGPHFHAGTPKNDFMAVSVDGRHLCAASVDNPATES
ncbi:HNH/endonuclease VII fold putative polymorphic toxin [Streptomyces sp. NPDC096046]|uniref:HNH/endonuclease VII fold putative polymorphic toxin n=1 Tax=Streptomyces sp. NPDC096046 TaxID=3155542 RepID=UPI0033210AE4